ncbi:MAG: hypothetical protein DRH24_17615 [Deltaproteobacteria bacterium]|nr:MAG: hypothetical protein DRH24_17615 [Deltaproteobacteria bacterium]
MKGFPWNVLVGAFIGIFVVQIWGAKKVETRFTMAFDFRHPDLLLYLRVAFPFMICSTISFSISIVAKLSRIMIYKKVVIIISMLIFPIWFFPPLK